ncbi:HET-domain-containing protein [Mollisia scopiformis]|uniref:HET-domain-containing protein n=1 Tax=Mollisia scopiformis TaxID=149040 RepID=A0A132BBK7_MOLSC|nr:HET-domain-containing protein [Mollisia scopiformis]KUJ09653.1 HET-domain-containing protein [Mollisia scopiformis]
MLCEFCCKVSIDNLIELAKVEFSAQFFPEKAYYQHHDSYASLISAATAGCELCQLIRDAITTYKIGGSDFYWEGRTTESAILETESEGHATDLKMCINMHHLNPGGKLEDVELFDELMVQVGPPIESESDDPDEYLKVPPLNLSLTVPRGKPVYHQNYRIGRFQTNPDLGSETNFDIAKSWLNNCVTTHEKCTARQAVDLPTRVIDVGPLAGSQEPKLYCSKDIRGSYIALSHCWGGPVSPLLKMANIEAFQSSIPFLDLPANFRDAITVTRQLGIRYLWIDSLCIIQDSKRDWDIESKKMGSIYRDALLTISAATSSRSTDGFLKSPPSSAEPEKNIPLHLTADSGSEAIVYISKPPQTPEDLRDLFYQAPLNKRGWCLQERILSAQILHYGSKQIYWQCAQGFLSADGVPHGVAMPEEEMYPEIASIIHPSILKGPIPKKPNLDLVLEEYYLLVQVYSSRKLSFDTDKFPAFSGLAQHVHSYLGGDYIAGIWSTDFRHGLLWFNELTTCKHVRPYRAPTWSWAVTNEPVVFPARCDTPFPEYAVELILYDINLETNAYSQVESGELTLYGLTKELVRSRQLTNISYPEMATAHVYFDEAEEEGGAIEQWSAVFQTKAGDDDYLLSVINGSGTEWPQPEWRIDFELFSPREYTVLLVDVRTGQQDGATVYHGNGLVLSKAEGKEHMYERVGYISLTPREKEDFEEWMETWGRENVTII